MGSVRVFPGDRVLAELDVEELRREWRTAQREMMAMSDEMIAVAEALWPLSGSERPANLHEEGVTGAELVAGVKSLHEYCDRLLAENRRLRWALASLGGRE